MRSQFTSKWIPALICNQQILRDSAFAVTIPAACEPNIIGAVGLEEPHRANACFKVQALIVQSACAVLLNDVTFQ